jgi:hypothetical protein
MGLPADASGAYRPNPQATTKLAPRPSSQKGYPAKDLAGLPSFARLRGIVPCSPAETGGRKMKKQFEVASLPALFILSSFYHSEKA